MSTEPTPHHSARRIERATHELGRGVAPFVAATLFEDSRAYTGSRQLDGTRRPTGSRRGAAARLFVLGLLLALVSTGVGCSGGGSGGSSDGLATIASAPVDLAPGQTSATLSWEASAGPVDGYLVFKSTNNSSYAYDGFANTNQYTITGAPGDSVRLFVVARGTNDTQSQSSPASPPIRFHAAVATTASTNSTSTASATTAGVGVSTVSSANVVAPIEDSEAHSTTELATLPDEVGDASAEDEATGAAPIDEALRDQLLRSGARLPLDELESNANLWLQGFVDEQVGAGVSLVATGELGGDSRRDLVWRDSAGQIFVSDGADLATTDDVPSTFAEAIRLHSTERIAALDDFDGDGVAEWLIEDTVTGEAWIAASGETRPDFVAVLSPGPNARLAGHGDFDGDGRAEILWRHPDRSYAVGRPDAALAEIDWTSLNLADVQASDLLGVDDVDADGLDDLIFRDAANAIRLGLARPNDLGQAAFEGAPAPLGSTQGLEPIATLDFDGDGGADIAWWSDAGVMLWDLQVAY